MIIPTFIRQQYIDLRTGYLMPGMQLYHDQLNLQLQRNFSQNGCVMPPLKTEEIQRITNPLNVNSVQNGTVFYDTDTDQLKVLQGNQVKVINTT
jgi:hypothetical protein